MSVGSPTIVRADAPVAPTGDPAGGRKRPSIPFLPGLEGLRGVALIGVMLFHAGFGWAKGGFLGVSTFFTLSGFLITLLLVWEFSTNKRIDLKQFWLRRYRRLMPASLVCLAGIAIFATVLSTPGQLASLRGDIFAALAYVANWRFILTGQSYAQLFQSPSPVLHFWSLAIEEQFYLVFPVVVAGTLLAARGSRRVLAGVLTVLAGLSLLAMFLLYTPGDPSRVYYGTLTRAFELLLGALLALLLSHPGGFVLRIPRWAWVVAGSVGAVVTLALWTTTSQSAPWLYRGGLAGYAVMSALLIVAAVRRGPIRWVLALPPIRWLGAVSYGAYLYHWPIYLWLTPGRTHLSIWPLFGVRAAVTFVLAAVSARLIERPIRLRSLSPRIPLAFVSGAAVAAIVVVTVMVTASPPTDPITFDTPELPSFDGLPHATTSTVPLAPGATLAPTSLLPAPIPLLTGEKPRILVMGDSAALTLGDGLLRLARERGDVTVFDAGKLGCSIGRGGLLRYLGEPIQAYDYCDWSVDANDPSLIAGIQPHVIATLYGTWDVVDRQIPGDGQWRSFGDPVYDRFLRAEISRYMDVHLAQGSTLVMLSHPYIEAGVKSPLPGPFPENEESRMDALNEMVRQVAATKKRVVVLDLEAHMRSTPEGELDLGDRDDGIHWTKDGAYKLAPWLADSLLAIANGTALPPVDTGG